MKKLIESLIPDFMIFNIALLLGSAFTSFCIFLNQFMKKYYFSDMEFLGFLLIALTLDTLSGSLKHTLHKPSTFKASIFGEKLIRKSMGIGFGLGLTHLIAFSIFKEDFWTSYTLMFGEATMMMYLLKSIDENIEDMTYKKLSFSILLKTFFEYSLNKFNPQTQTKEEKNAEKQN